VAARLDILLPTIPTQTQARTTISTASRQRSIRIKQDRNSALPLAARRGNTLVSICKRIIGGDRPAHELEILVLPGGHSSGALSRIGILVFFEAG
jgi:hypothetical protein